MWCWRWFFLLKHLNKFWICDIYADMLTRIEALNLRFWCRRWENMQLMLISPRKCYFFINTQFFVMDTGDSHMLLLETWRMWVLKNSRYIWTSCCRLCPMLKKTPCIKGNFEYQQYPCWNFQWKGWGICSVLKWAGRIPHTFWIVKPMPI